MKNLYIPILFLLLLLVLAACGDSSDPNATDGEAEGNAEESVEEEKGDEAKGPIEITDASGNTLTFDEAPETIATLDSGTLDILHELDATIVGRPSTSEEVDPALEDATEIGNPHEPNFEMIAQANPDVLVVPMSFKRYEGNINDQGTELIYTEANSVEDIQESIHTFGSLFHKEDESEEINQNITDIIEEFESNDAPATKTLLVYGAPGTYLAALPNSLSGDLLEKAGGENIASDFPAEEDYPQYASLSSEKIIEENPERIMLITHGDPEGVKDAFEEEMGQNATWKNLDAVQNDQVVVLPSDLFGANPGTRVTEALEVMQENLAEEE
ncbi:ABC transporter substrate-binding protein [Oceanobacillus jeddahense]|uniref:ABC transporter substrate-binding protein n=1 Tax=Oceanobacillus jeddahense TaxID=1462527 RepID=UPI0009DD1953|nr:ABC transporter substrate-binding protein [Oceanobacillus jeddahense]